MLPRVLHTYQNHHLDSLRWEKFVPREGDIVVSTSIKSGTTLTQELVRHLIFAGDTSKPWHTTPLLTMCPWLDVRTPPLDELIQRLEAQTHRRSIKTHLPLDGLIYFPQIKYIVVGRDPRDVFMSLWNHYSRYASRAYARFNDTPGRVGAPLPPSGDDIHKFWSMWITQGWFEWEQEGYPFWGNMHHSQSWWDYRHLNNIYFVHYQDLLTDLAGEVRGIADFLEIAIADAEIEALLPTLTLDAMRENDARLGGISMWDDGSTAFFFKGTNGRWQGVLSPDELAQYEATAARVLTPACRSWLEQGRVAISK